MRGFPDQDCVMWLLLAEEAGAYAIRDSHDKFRIEIWGVGQRWKGGMDSLESDTDQNLVGP